MDGNRKPQTQTTHMLGFIELYTHTSRQAQAGKEWCVGGFLWESMLLARRSPSLAAPCMLSVATRFRSVGEQTGLSALAAKSSTLKRHDTLGLASDIVVDSYSSLGFVVNGVSLVGPVLLLPNASLLFGASKLQDLTPASLSLLTLLDSPIDMLVLGCGRTSARVPSAVQMWCEERGISIEALPTKHACSTFNFMVAENRNVAGILWPMGDISVPSDA